MNRKSLKQQTYIKIGLILGIIVVGLLIINQFSIRLDLTQGNQYSLSKTSKKLIKGLDDIVNVKVYFSKELPNYLLTTRQEVDDLLKEYKNYGGSKLKIEYIDPASDPELEKEVQSLRIPKLQFNVLEDDKYQVTNGYLGLAVMYGDKTEVLPVIENVGNFEYDLTLAIKKVMAKDLLRIAFITGHGERSSADSNTLKKILEKQYLLQDIDLINGALIPEFINTIVIAGPTQAYNDRSLYIIDQFLMRGGSVLLLNERVNVDGTLQASAIDNNLDALLSSYGLRVNQDLVDDVSNEMANFTQGYVQFFVPYPLWVKVVPDNFDQNNVIVNKLESLVLPWASSVEYIGSEENREVSYMVKSTNKAWTQSQDYNLDPQGQQNTFNVQAQAQKNLAVSVFGKFQSYFSNKDLPSPPNNDSAAEVFINGTDWARLVVVGDANFMDEGFIKTFSANQVFAQNIIDGLTQDADLIAIRSKSVTDRALKDLVPGQKNTIKYSVIFGPTILVVIYGLLRFMSRRKKSFVDEL